MLRSGDSIRLTTSELEEFRRMTNDLAKAPTTVQEHDARIDIAIYNWTSTGTAEGRLMAALAESLKIVPSVPVAPKVPLELVLPPLAALRKRFGEHWEIDASRMPLSEMLHMAIEEGNKYRERFPNASHLYDEFKQEITALMPEDD